MFDTLTLLACLIGNDPGHSTQLTMKPPFLEKENKIICVQRTQSPQFQWKDVPPEASSLAFIIKDANTFTTMNKQKYYWVVYNLPVQTTQLPYGANVHMSPYDEGVNSWGEKNYHSICADNTEYPVIVELYALDKRFSATTPMTGEVLEQKIKGHVLAKTIVWE
ncbi:MAG TPA: hypothetical protein VJK30_01270 [Coxiellaceae bacterium]|nr:MAG: hypothetical protein A3E81_04675 [Gammaproteobacteria bacterium RIFCSPHIGHO2_12_FULL_36_30]HLB55950.1 hypothetical protein [Coxiellaceae bacterium]